MDSFEQAYDDFIDNNREAKRYKISDYFVTLMRGDNSVEIHKHRDGCKTPLNRGFEDDRELIMLTFENGFHEMFSFGDHSGERVFRNNGGDSMTLSRSKMKAPLDKKYGALVGKNSGLLRACEKVILRLFYRVPWRK